MRDYLLNLYRHQAWADAEHWRAFEAHAGALQDKAIWDRLRHLHLVQRAFLAIVRGADPFGIIKRMQSDTIAPPELKAMARECHAEAAQCVIALDDASLAQVVPIPWFKDPPLSLSVADALTQAAMHSHYHRGQNATRLRELGAAPPTTDYIAWVWKGRPTAGWD